MVLTASSVYICCCAQAKFRHFEKIDTSKYYKLWSLQQAEAVDLAQQVLDADRIIHQQQLGWQWQAPDDGVFVSPHEASAMAAAAATERAAAAGKAATANANGDQADATSAAGDHVSSSHAGGGGEDHADDEDEDGDETTKGATASEKCSAEVGGTCLLPIVCH